MTDEAIRRYSAWLEVVYPHALKCDSWMTVTTKRPDADPDRLAGEVQKFLRRINRKALGKNWLSKKEKWAKAVIFFEEAPSGAHAHIFIRLPEGEYRDKQLSRPSIFTGCQPFLVGGRKGGLKPQRRSQTWIV